MTQRLLGAAFVLCFTPLATAQTAAWINEFHYDNVGTDVGEFVEVVLPAGVSTTAYTLYHYNGSNGVRITSRTVNQCTAGASVDGDGDSINDFTFYTCTFGSTLQNDTEGFALVGPDPFNPAYPVLQFISYEGVFAATEGPATGQNSVDVRVAESDASTPGGFSLQLTGSGLAYESFTWSAPSAQTPGQSNNGQTFALPTTVQTTYSFGAGTDDVAGYRQLGAAVAGIRVDGLAKRNLVQGIDGGGGFVAQYPAADGTTPNTKGPNLFTAYVEGGGFSGDGYVIPQSTAAFLQAGRGFFWYLFDRNIDPDDTNESGGGTSESVELPQTQTYTGFTLPGDGTPRTDYTLAFNVAAGNTSYLIANPINSDFNLTGVTARTQGSVLSTTFQVYDPGDNAYAMLTAGTDPLATGQGAWAEVTGVTAPALVFGYDFDAVSAGGTFHGRRAPDTRVVLRLDGQAGGERTLDQAAVLRFTDAAQTGWDRDDATKLTPLRTPYALLAVTGERDGQVVRQAVRSLPAGLVTTPVAFTTTDAGSFLVSADVPSGWTARLRDLETGVETNLAAATYAFDGEAGGWADRFELTVSSLSTAIDDDATGTARVGQPWPNPSTGGARLAVSVAAPERVTATVFDALGRQVAIAFDGEIAPGAEQSVSLPGSLAPGVYVVRVQGATFRESRQFVVTR